MWNSYNENPKGHKVGDCVVRAISTALDQSWEQTYIGLCLQGFEDADLPSSNAVWSRYLKRRGWKRHTIDEDCTIEDFCKAHPNGTFVVGTGSHAVCVRNGELIDSWNSLGEYALYYFTKRKDN